MAFQCIRCKAEIERSYRACPFCGEQITDFLRTHADQPLDGKYRIVDRLGAGGMGEVYKAEHTFLGNTRVIKVIRPQISGSADAHDRFLREAKAATRIQHPNVATLHDFSSLPDGSHYMVWEYIDGENLAQRMRVRGPLQPRYAVGLIIQALAGLDAIHRAGIIHRDISPENLMVQTDPDGSERVKIIDLGVAKVDGGDDGATRAGVFVGKLRYASPEQLGFLNEGEKIDGRADIFSIAMVLYELLTGRPPFEATSPHEYVLLHSRERQIRPIEMNGIPGGEALQRVLERALDRDRARRYATAKEFAAALEDVQRTLPDPGAMATMEVASPFDAETTMRVTPAPGSNTLAADVAAAPTIRTPLPAATIPQRPLAAKTVIEEAPAPSQRRSLLPIVAVIALLLVAVGVTAFFMMQARRTEEVAQNTTTTAAPVAPSATTVAVDATTSGTTPTDTMVTEVPVVVPDTAPTTTAAAPPVTPATHETKPAPPEPQTTTREEAPAPPPSSSSGATYVEGGDSDANDELLAALRHELRGVDRISISGIGEGQQRLAAIIRSELSDVTVASGADVVVNFESTLRPLGRGRKERSANATITKNGRTIFRYRLGPEVYRIGDTPVEAFSRVLIDAFDR